MVNTISNPDLRTNARHINAGRRRVRALTASAATALALTAGTIAPTAGAEPADPAPAQTQHETGPAVESTGETVGDQSDQARLDAAIDAAQQEGRISADQEWVADGYFPIARADDRAVAAQVITVAGATGSSPQAVLLYGPDDGAYLGTAAVPEGYEADPSFGPDAGQVESVTATDADSITVRWKDRDGVLDDVTYQYVDGEFTVV
ncbi:hypothetical protein QP932_10095 [Corynebacterium freneyi]|uniref:hypothetical protein n=1 Tax=Corynebacterium freneyi TaxID=134034 RepID=UPI00254E4072|nr:hypothetical protein [Corynebacterium freneyi]MDK8768840.1 hypothetical protein [Corynebacterium freneyi]